MIVANLLFFFFAHLVSSSHLYKINEKMKFTHIHKHRKREPLLQLSNSEAHNNKAGLHVALYMKNLK